MKNRTRKDPDYTNCRIQFIDDQSELDVTIKATHDVGLDDDEIFFYGLSYAACQKAFKNNEICEGEWRIINIYN